MTSFRGTPQRCPQYFSLCICYTFPPKVAFSQTGDCRSFCWISPDPIHHSITNRNQSQILPDSEFKNPEEEEGGNDLCASVAKASTPDVDLVTTWSKEKFNLIICFAIYF